MVSFKLGKEIEKDIFRRHEMCIFTVGIIVKHADSLVKSKRFAVRLHTFQIDLFCSDLYKCGYRTRTGSIHHVLRQPLYHKWQYL